jgi:mRNA interferase RelE/StbE
VYRLTFKKSVRKELDAISNPDFLKIDEAILSLKKQLFPHPQSKKLKGQDRYRLRVGNYRVVYMVEGAEGSYDLSRLASKRGLPIVFYKMKEKGITQRK